MRFKVSTKRNAREELQDKQGGRIALWLFWGLSAVLESLEECASHFDIASAAVEGGGELWWWFLD